MLFNSFSFGVLAVVTVVLYYLPPFKKLQVLMLILASLIFYASDRPDLLPVLLFSTAFSAVLSYLVIFGNVRLRKIYAAAGVILSLGILTYYKYWSRLPLGLSFITFQEISLLVDTFRGNKIDSYKNMISKNPYNHSMNVTLFVAFFPKLIAGPIMKAHDFLPQIGVKQLKDVDWDHALRALILGYFLKMVIADNLKDYTFMMAFPYFDSLSSINLLILSFGYSVQFFADFAGYSLIAIGLASLFGYRLSTNFNFPYISGSFSEFWTRWHITLSSFLKEYLYIPLGGNRRGALRTYMNLMIVMFLGGVWHGATWNFALWGVCHGLFLSIERGLRERISVPDNSLVRGFRALLVFTCVTFAWLLFALTDFSHTIRYFQAIFNNTGLLMPSNILYILVYSLPVILYHGYYLYTRNRPLKGYLSLETVAYSLMLFLIITNSGSSTKFAYFQF
jgi:alginate O-acetyltransferase complex protein AlgI